jgi:adenylyl- and sulfurtransferase ThiI
MIKPKLIFKIHFLKLNVFVVGKEDGAHKILRNILGTQEVVETGKIKSEINEIVKAKVKLEKMGHDERKVETDFKIRKYNKRHQREISALQ